MSKAQLCCVPGSVRYCILLLTIVSTSFLFANLILFSIAVLQEEHAVVETSTDAGTISLTTLERRRLVRDVDMKNIVNDTVDVSSAISNVTEMLISKSSSIESRWHETTDIPHGGPLTVEDTATIRLLSKADEVGLEEKIPTTKGTSTTKGTPTTEASTVKMAELGKGVYIDKDLEHNDDKLDSWGEKDKERSPVLIAGITHTTLTERVQFFLTWAAPGLGMLLGTFPVMYMSKSFDGRKFFTTFMLLSGISTAFLAIAPHIEHRRLLTIICRFVQGFAFASAFPVIGTMTANWATLKQQFFFLVFCTLFIQVASMISWPLSALLFRFSYKLPFLIQSTCTIFLAVMWYTCYREKPQYHPVVNGLELNKIVAGKIKAENNRVVAEAPLKMLIISFPVWAIWIAVFGYFIAISTAVQFLPTYSYSVMHESQQSSALIATLPFVFMFIITLLHGLWHYLALMFSDRVSILAYNTVSFALCSLIFIILAIFPPGDKFTYSLAAPFTLILSFLVFSLYGFYRSVTLVGRCFAQFIVSYMHVSAGLAFIVTAAAVTFFIRENVAHEWRVVFLLQAALLLVCAVIFGAFGSAAPEEWSKDSWDPSAARPMITFDQIDYHNDECGLLEMRIVR